jgi:hypothetical protein
VETNKGTSRAAIHWPRSSQTNKVQARTTGTGCSGGPDDPLAPVAVVVERANKRKKHSRAPQ